MKLRRGAALLIPLDHWTERKIFWYSVLVCFVLIPMLFIPPFLFSIDYITQRGEERFMNLDLERATNLLHNELRAVDHGLYDWSAWDDMYAFVAGEGPDFVDTHVSDLAVMNLGIEFLIVVDPQGTVVLQKHVDAVSKKQEPFPFAAQQMMAMYPVLLRHASLDSAVSGYVVVDGQPLMVAARPIIQSSFQGPIRGTLIFGRTLDGDELERLVFLSQRAVDIHVRSEAGWQEIPADAGAALEAGANHLVYDHNGKLLMGYQVLKDINGANPLLVSVTGSHDLRQLAVTAGVFYRIAVALLGVIVFAIVRPLAATTLRSYNEYKEYVERFRAVVEQSSEAIMLIQGDWSILEANPASRRILGLKEFGTIPLRLTSILSSETVLDRALLARLCAGEKVELPCTRRDGVAFALEFSASAFHYAGQEVFSLHLRDITRRKAAETALRASEERYQLATRGANDGLWDWNLMTNQIYYSSRLKAMLGYAPDEIQDDPDAWMQRIHADDRLAFQTQLSDHLHQRSELFQCEHRVRRKDGQYRWMLARGVAVWNPDGYVHRMAGSLTDIHDRKHIEEQLRHDALHDGLTGLANRMLLLDRLRHVNERKKRKPELVFSLFFLDFDRFKQINDSLGHAIGDGVLVEASHRLANCLRAADTVARFAGAGTLARLAGDEFVILLEDICSREDILPVAERVIAALNAPMQVNGHEVHLSVSVGIVTPEHTYDDPEAIIRDADIAMYQAKQRGGSSIVEFDQQMFYQVAGRMQLENELRHAVERSEFTTFYQPIYSLVDDTLVGFEALVRWNHPERGLLSPVDFLDIAEETGLIVPMGYFVLRQACEQMQEWQRKFQPSVPLTISVNLSARQLAHPGLVGQIRSILGETGYNPACLWLEVTESTFIKNVDSVRITLEQLRALGIRIEIDDFGTGYSSLSYLQNLPVDGFKIDRSFIAGLDSNGQQIVKTLVALGHSLGLNEVAEGVENEGQKQYLKSLDCRYFQGYLMAKPMSLANIEEILATVAEAT